MKTRVDERFREEAESFKLRFRCEDCMAYEQERGGCAHGYPNAEHVAAELGAAESVVFCKEFEVA
jgi:hypothetical protein